MKMRERGFTLIELMIVVAIIGILAAAAIPRFGDLINKARESNAKAALGSIRSAATIYYGRNEGETPPTLGALTAENFINEIPGVNFRSYDAAGDMDDPVEWGSNANLATLRDWDTERVGHTTGWSYDESEFHIWVGQDGLDSGNKDLHSW